MKSQDLSEKEFLYISSVTPLINVDLFVVNEFEEVLLSWRDDEYCGTGWHIPGGIIRHGETMKERLLQTANNELGSIPQFESSPCKITEIFLNQEYRDHFISHLFIGRC
ncbi:NUDIX domain-containing protein [Ruminococcus albus]|uniref:NUDIX domain-containing protein n=1 Tax=Ruminococcus albus TaxID=1264 RepID=UPI00094233C3|nr:NUDIX domain-containing protein [Ruminococcus albus]